MTDIALLGAEATADLDTALAMPVDAVDVCLPTPLHNRSPNWPPAGTSCSRSRSP